MTQAAAVPNGTELDKFSDPSLSPRRVGELLGIENKSGIARELKVSPRTIDNWMAKRVIPFIRINRAVRFDVARVKSALRRFEVCAAGERRKGGERDLLNASERARTLKREINRLVFDFTKGKRA